MDLLKVGTVEIKDTNLGNIDDLVNLCIPNEKRSDPLFAEGMRAKKRWATHALKKQGSIAKLAYLDSRPVGLIQYQLNPEERLVEIHCIFVPEEENLRRGIGRSLLQALIEEMKEPKPQFNNTRPVALVARAFQVPGRYPQHKFYQRMGFKRMKEDDPLLLYYPLQEGYVHHPKEKEFIPQEEDEGKALIFYPPSCPFCIYFSEKIKESINEVNPGIPIRMINKFEAPEEVEKRGQVPSLAVNRKQIKAFFMDKENFQKEVRQASE